MKKTQIIEFLEGKKPFVISDELHKATKIVSFTEKMDFYYPLLWQKISYKAYPRLKNIKLPAPLKIKASLGRTILSRRSKRKFLNEDLTLREISTLLLFSGGITYKKGQNWNKALRAYPSAGARYPLEIYLIINTVKLIEKGLYHYNVKEHSLELLRTGDFRKFIGKNTGQKWLEKAGIIILISAVFDRTRVKYGERGYRFVLLDAGHLAQNMYLAANALNFGCCGVGGFADNKFNQLLDLQGQGEQIIYLLGIGKTKK